MKFPQKSRKTDQDVNRDLTPPRKPYLDFRKLPDSRSHKIKPSLTEGDSISHHALETHMKNLADHCEGCISDSNQSGLDVTTPQIRNKLTRKPLQDQSNNIPNKSHGEKSRTPTRRVSSQVDSCGVSKTAEKAESSNLILLPD